jgi:GxxExxY protein
VHENDLSKVIVDAGLSVHRELGPGLLESAYEAALHHTLVTRGLGVERQVAIPFVFRGARLGDAFRADLVVQRLVLVEVKSAVETSPIYRQQVLTYLRLSGLRVGLLMNFGAALFKDGLERFVQGSVSLPARARDDVIASVPRR